MSGFRSHYIEEGVYNAILRYYMHRANWKYIEMFKLPPFSNQFAFSMRLDFLESGTVVLSIYIVRRREDRISTQTWGDVW